MLGNIFFSLQYFLNSLSCFFENFESVLVFIYDSEKKKIKNKKKKRKTSPNSPTQAIPHSYGPSPKYVAIFIALWSYVQFCVGV